MLRIEHVQDILVLTPVERQLTVSDVPDFRRQAEEAIEGNPKVILDLRNVQFVDSTMLGAMISLKRLNSQSGGSLYLTALTEQVLGLFKVSRMDELFSIKETKDEALNSFK